MQTRENFDLQLRLRHILDLPQEFGYFCIYHPKDQLMFVWAIFESGHRLRTMKRKQGSVVTIAGVEEASMRPSTGGMHLVVITNSGQWTLLVAYVWSPLTKLREKQHQCI